MFSGHIGGNEGRGQEVTKRSLRNPYTTTIQVITNINFFKEGHVYI